MQQTLSQFDSVVGPTGLFCSGNLLFVMGREKKIFDISRPDSPQHLSSFSLPSDGYQEQLIARHRNWIFFSAGYQGVYILDITDPVNANVVKVLPESVFKLKHYKDNLFISASGAAGGRAYEILSPTASIERARIVSHLFDFLICQEFLFCGSMVAGFNIADLSDIDSPRLINQPLGKFECFSLDTLYNSIILVKDEGGHLLIVETSCPAAIKVLSRIACRLMPYRSFFSCPPFLVLWVGEGSERAFWVMDCSDPTNPRRLFTYHLAEVSYVKQLDRTFAIWGQKSPSTNRVVSTFQILGLMSNGELRRLISIGPMEEIYSVTLIPGRAYLATADGVFSVAIPQV